MVGTLLVCEIELIKGGGGTNRDYALCLTRCASTVVPSLWLQVLVLFLKLHNTPPVSEEMSLVGFRKEHGMCRLWLFSWLHAELYRSSAELHIPVEDISDRLLTLFLHRMQSTGGNSSHCSQKKKKKKALT